METVNIHIGPLVVDHADYDRDGRLIVTVPETVEASAAELGPPLTAA